MSKMIQVRHVPDQLHRRLKVRAASVGMSLSDFLRLELERTAAQLTADELRERLAALSVVTMDETAADAVRAERDAR
jgi:plasmid stability protein